MNDIFKHTGNIFIKAMIFDFDKGHITCVGHSHTYDHVTCLAYGSVIVKSDSMEKRFDAPAFIDIPAGEHHEITALVDKTVAYCIHDTRGLDVDDLGEPWGE